MNPLKSVSYCSGRPGPRLIVLGAVHGNEVCGSLAIGQVMAKFDAGELALIVGQVTFVSVTNPLAYAKNARAGDRNLNRGLQPTDAPKEFEDEVANWLCPLLAAHDILLDLHSFQGQGEPFVFIGPENNQGTIEPFRHAELEEGQASRRVTVVQPFQAVARPGQIEPFRAHQSVRIWEDDEPIERCDHVGTVCTGGNDVPSLKLIETSPAASKFIGCIVLVDNLAKLQSLHVASGSWDGTCEQAEVGQRVEDCSAADIHRVWVVVLVTLERHRPASDRAHVSGRADTVPFACTRVWR